MNTHNTIWRAIRTVRARMREFHYATSGNCYEAALTVGILIKRSDPNCIVNLISGKVRNRRHWWLLVNGIIIDPTHDQFDPLPMTKEYEVINFDGMDFEELSCLILGRKNVNQVDQR